MASKTDCLVECYEYEYCYYLAKAVFNTEKAAGQILGMNK